MIRVLQVVNIMNRAGIETLLMNYYRALDKEKIQFDFLTHRKEKGQYDEEIASMGGIVYHAPRLYPQYYVRYFNWMQQFFSQHPEYRIVHSHIDAMSFFPLSAAKRADIPVRIAHSHSTKIEIGLKYPIKLACKLFMPAAANCFWACGTSAGKFLFGNRNDLVVLPNAINVDAFKYDEKVRNRVRQELCMGDALVVGHVGRFLKVKNHSFILDVFEELNKNNSNTRLLLVGEGPLKASIQARVQKKGLMDKVIFLGNRENVSEYNQAMDVFVLPSLYEGIPVVGIEAQAAGLPCIFSSKVPIEVGLLDSCIFLDLHKGAKAWARTIAEAFENNRSEGFKAVIKCGYNVHDASKKLINKYNQLLSASDDQGKMKL